MMRSVVDYQIVVETTSSKLSEEVQKELQKDWLPLGGVSCCNDEGNALWSQAMVKVKE